jgi:N-acetylmuramoyl-L-alanine amidase
MRKWIVLSLALLFITGAIFSFSEPTYAAQSRAEKLYKSASARLAKVKKDRRKARQRVQWERCISGFDAVIEKYPGSPYAGYACFSKADAYSGMYKVSRAKSDLDAAVKTYESFVDKYPANEYADEALQRLAGIYIARGDKGAAAKKYKQLSDNYPQSIYARHADDKPKATPKAAHVEEAPSEPAAAADAPPEKPVEKPADVADVPEKLADAPAETQAAPAPARNDGRVEIREIRHWSNPGYTRVVFDLDGKVKFKATRIRKPDRLFFDISRAKLNGPMKGTPIDINDGVLKGIRAGQYSADTVRVVFDLENSVKSYKTILLSDPERLMVDVISKETVHRKRGKGRFITLRRSLRDEPLPPVLAKSEPPPVNANLTSTAPKTITVTAMSEEPDEEEQDMTQAEQAPEAPAPLAAALPEPTKAVTARPALVREAKLCDGRIVIDPGHGGHDTGAIGKEGLLEKDVVLDVGLRLRDILKKEFGCKVIMTRDKDVFIPLESRTGIAAQQDADLFISIHANASKNRKARGIETYLLNLTKDRGIMEVAARENMMSMAKMGDLETILKDLILDNKREDSLKLAHAVQGKLIDGLDGVNGSLKDKGVKQGPFLVLYGASMPSILTEVGFISNPEEEKLLGSPDYRQKVAQAIFDGIKDYVAKSGNENDVAAYSPAE